MDDSIKKDYEKITRQKHPKAPVLRNCINAFFFGGLVCVIGQGIQNIYISLGFAPEDAADPTVATMIFIAALLTGLGVFDKISKIAGAGVGIPVTGFANSVTSSALEFKREGFVHGVASKMFVLAGSVIVYGVVTAFIIGIISAII